MNAAAVQKVNREVAARNPKLEGKRPKISEQAPGRYLLVYAYVDELPGNRRLEQNVRVVADDEGRILKMSTSRG